MESRACTLRRDEIRRLIEDACQLARTHADVVGSPKRLEELGLRLSADRFQLAVVGQFKRGKSTLLNAIIGRPLLPAAAIPATAVATVISSGDTRALTVTFVSGATETQAVESDDVLANRLAELVTEEGNPRNERDVDRVHAVGPWPLLSEGIVLVDTPGIGSTHLHNTAAARSALTECDAALLVFSADLPITEQEEAYAREVQAAVPNIVVVMNKADLATDADRQALERLLRSRLQQVFPTDRDMPIWSVSAKAALAAKVGGDAGALDRSGLPGLERHLTDVLVHERHALLEEAIAGKAASIVAALGARLGLRHAALVLPIEELEQKAALFVAVAEAAEKEGRICLDLLHADGARVRARLDAGCDALYERARGPLRSDLMRLIRESPTPQSAREKVMEAVEAFFKAAKADLVVRVRSDITDCVKDHLARMEAIVERVGQSATEIMGVTVLTAEENPALPPLREPYWVWTGLPDTLDSLTMDALAKLLPRCLREARMRRAFRRGIDAALVRNVSNLQWALQQMADDAFRLLEPELAVGFRSLNLSVHEALHSARDRHWSRKAEQDDHLKQLASDAARLAKLANALTGLVQARLSLTDHVQF